MSDPTPIILSFNCTDPTGGSGLIADALTVASMGGHLAAVVTAVTVQDSLGVENVLAMEPDWIADQARALLEDMPVAALKIGFVPNVEVVATLAEIVADYPEVPLVLDPTLTNLRGDALADEDLVDALNQMLVPQATVVTPNLLEARRLLQDTLEEDEQGEPADLAAKLLTLGAEYVLITGAHEPTSDVVNRLYHEHDGLVAESSWPRLPHSYHGAGATLSAGIACGLANGLSVKEAAVDAQDYTWQTLSSAFRPGMGQFLPDRMYWASNENESGEEAPPPAG